MSLATTGMPVDVDVLLYYSNAWNSIVKGTTNYVYARDPITINRGTTSEATTADPSSCTFTVNNRAGRFSPRNPNGALFGLIGRNTPVRVRSGLRLTENFGLCCNGDNYEPDGAFTNDNAALDIVGDIDIRAEFKAFRMDTTMMLAGKGIFDGTGGTQLSYQVLLGVNAAGTPHVTFRWSTNGTTAQFVDHDMTALVVGTHMAVRVTMAVSSGGNHIISFYTSSDGTVGGTWNLDGSASTIAGTTSIFSGTGALAVGMQVTSNQFNDNAFRGVIYAVRVLNSIGGTAVANPDFGSQTENTTSFTDAAGRTWNLLLTAHIGYYRFTRFTGEVSDWPVQWDNTGRDVYSQITAAGISRRLGQGQNAAQQDAMVAFVSGTPYRRFWQGQTQFDASGSKPLVAVGATAQSVVFGGGDLGLGSKVISMPDTGPTRDANGYLQSGYLTGQIQAYDPNHFAAGFAFDSDSLGPTIFVFTGFSVEGFSREWEVQLRADGVNNDIVVFERSNQFSTGIITVSTLGASASLAGRTSGQPHSVFFTLDQNGTGVDWNVYFDAVSVVNGTAASQLLSVDFELHIAYQTADGNTPINLGYITAYAGGSIPTPANFHQAALRFTGETAATRITRICAANTIAVTLKGNSVDTQLMGPLSNSRILDAINEAAATDLGLLHDDTSALGLKYHTRASLYNQAPVLTIDYTAAVLSAAPDPTDDDLSLHNDVTVTNSSTGNTAEQILTSGPLSIQAPPNGVNTYPTSASVNTSTDGPLPDIARWIMNKSTIDKARYPSLPVNLLTPAVTGNAALANQIANLDVADRLALTKLPAWLPPDDVTLLAIGFQEQITQTQWTLDLNCAPADVYDVGVYGTARYDHENSTLGGTLTTTATGSISLVSAANTTLWTTDSAAFPMDLYIAGERVTFSAITGSSSPQTGTISARSVNGIVKSHSAGEAVRLFTRSRYAL